MCGIRDRGQGTGCKVQGARGRGPGTGDGVPFVVKKLITINLKLTQNSTLNDLS